MKIEEKYLVVVSGPSGCGKDTVVRQLMKLRSDVSLSVSCTTRARRENELDGRDYYFLERKEFERRIAEKRMLEYTEYAGNFYGTPMDELEQKLVGKNTVILVIEVKGAKRVKEMYPNSLLVFIIPPSLEELERRLKLRNTESELERGKRMRIAETELKSMADYDVVIENDIVEVCAEKLSFTIDKWQEEH